MALYETNLWTINSDEEKNAFLKNVEAALFGELMKMCSNVERFQSDLYYEINRVQDTVSRVVCDNEIVQFYFGTRRSGIDVWDYSTDANLAETYFVMNDDVSLVTVYPIIRRYGTVINFSHSPVTTLEEMLENF